MFWVKRQTAPSTQTTSNELSFGLEVIPAIVAPGGPGPVAPLLLKDLEIFSQIQRLTGSREMVPGGGNGLTFWIKRQIDPSVQATSYELSVGLAVIPTMAGSVISFSLFHVEHF
jgi:hypothetical protein